MKKKIKFTCIEEIIIKYKKKKAYISNTLRCKLFYLQNFFRPNYNIYIFIPTISGTSNDFSVVLKIVGIFNNGEEYSFLIPGDATGKSLKAIMNGNILYWNEIKEIK